MEGCDGVNYPTLPPGRSNKLYFQSHYVQFSSVQFTPLGCRPRLLRNVVARLSRVVLCCCLNLWDPCCCVHGLGLGRSDVAAD